MKDARFLFKCGIIICKVFVTIYGITVPLQNPNKCSRPFYIILWLPWRHDTVERPHQASGSINSGKFTFGVNSLRELYVFCWSIASLNGRMLNRWQFDEVQCSFSSFGLVFVQICVISVVYWNNCKHIAFSHFVQAQFLHDLSIIFGLSLLVLNSAPRGLSQCTLVFTFQ